LIDAGYHQAVVEFDPKKPSVARVYDALIGGKDNFGPDRDLFERLEAMSPGLVKVVTENKNFLERAVTYAARQGIGQFIDLGAGLPRPPLTHETAREVIPGARVAYVDNDPQVVAHLTAWYGHHDDRVTVAKADVANLGAVLAAAEGNLDLARPCVVVAGMLLHFYPADEARALIAAYLGAVAPGSYLIASSAYSCDQRAPAFWAVFGAAVRPVYPHPPEVFASFFDPAPLVAPGVSEAHAWRPGYSAAKGGLDTRRAILCGMGRTR
jgi:O-methyltransferase involved in polyketide biosynthesis